MASSEGLGLCRVVWKLRPWNNLINNVPGPPEIGTASWWQVDPSVLVYSIRSGPEYPDVPSGRSVTRLCLGRRLVNLSPVAQRTNALTLLIRWWHLAVAWLCPAQFYALYCCIVFGCEIFTVRCLSCTNQRLESLPLFLIFFFREIRSIRTFSSFSMFER